MINTWIDDFEKVNKNALAAEWFVSPLEYLWSDGKNHFDKIFRDGVTPHSRFDQMVSPTLYRTTMQVDFRAKMTVFAFMRETIANSYGVEFESGLLAFYQLDYLACLSQWIYVIEGYCRKLFSVTSPSNVKYSHWIIPRTGDTTRDRLIKCLAEALGKYLDGIMFKRESDPHIERLSRHLLLHGNLENKDFFSQKNCLILMFLLDALVVIEMVKNMNFPTIFSERPGEVERIKRRKALYMMKLKHAFADENILKIELLKEYL
ncbi:hypothetical protein [Gluconobacter sp. P5B12]|uniref:hypothetical protein n=1 Tax=Gluconobacter sp. P5B12 TaxID=2762618 RepID=UPI001C04A409|nr:hypothetical protein [Gluconobacter sp. P5B12]